MLHFHSLKKLSGWQPQSYGVALQLIHYILIAYVFTTYLETRVKSQRPELGCVLIYKVKTLSLTLEGNRRRCTAHAFSGLRI
jgi:hypothetical protein